MKKLDTSLPMNTDREQFSARTQPGNFQWFKDEARIHGYFSPQHPTRSSVSKLLCAIKNGNFELKISIKTRLSAIELKENSERFVCRTPKGTLSWFKDKALKLGYEYGNEGSVSKLLDAICAGHIIIVKTKK